MKIEWVYLLLMEKMKYTFPAPENKEYRNSEGKLHRLDGPAYSFKNKQRGTKQGDYLETKEVNIQYYIDGKLHRTDGPALYQKKRKIGNNVIIRTKQIEWRINDKLHKLDGPAKIDNGHEHYYIEGKQYNKDAFYEHLKLLELKTMVTTTLETIKNSQADTGENNDYYNIPKDLVETLLEKLA